MTLLIDRSLLESIEESARLSIPEECCGLLIGRRDGDVHTVERVRPARNVWAGDRRRRYEIDPQVAFDTLREARTAGSEVVGFFHSHPDGTDQPSQYDVETAWQRKSYLIVTVTRGHVTGVRSWRLAPDGRRMVPERIH